MEKIISLFQRNYDGDRLVRDEVTPGAEWVLAGEGVATRKWDGTCCRIKDGKLWKRYEVKRGGRPPEGFEPATEVDPVTGKQQGWLLAGDGPEDRYHREAYLKVHEIYAHGPGVDEIRNPEDGTYELVGPKVQGNPDGYLSHWLIRHGTAVLESVPRDFDGLRSYLSEADIEGIVWHHPDGRMVKIKTKDFGLKRRKALEVAS